MDILEFSKVAAALLAISLATERLVAVVKTLLPSWFAVEQKTEAKEVDLERDKWRRFRVQLVAFGAAWLTTALLVTGGWPPDFFGDLTVGPDTEVAAWLVGFLATGGSAFWAQVVGYTGGLKDITQTRKATESLAFDAAARSMGKIPVDSGVVARGAKADDGAIRDQIGIELDSAPPRTATTELPNA
jgi:hypothetical protein